MEDVVVAEGVMWEDNPWWIVFDRECSEYGGKPCRHCRDYKTVIHTRSHDSSTYTEGVWICPRLIVVDNEGGCNSTGLCLDCVLEVVKQLP